ncbi:hypothetical protein ACROYT_G006088 [Oculina patagonica]
MAYEWKCLALTFCVIVFVSFFCNCKAARPRNGEKREAYIHQVNDEVYDTLLLLVQGKFNVPVNERSRIQRNTVVRFWRRRDQFHLGTESTPTLYFAGKKVVKKSLIPVVVGKTFDKAKSGGCKKLRNRAASSYAGVSEKNILQVTSSDLKYRVHNAKFTNKAIPKPVTANHVQSQHQIDLVDLSKDPVRHNGKVYKYVLSVIDVFSRFLWLVPMESKSSSRVAKLLQQIYDKHGPPDRLQSDRGPEFEGQLRSLCKQFKIKMIKSRPYHPQSQGKVERSHRRLRKKIMYDFINLGKKGVNWASNLDAYNRILNEESKEELGWKSPFEVYFGRKSNILVKESLDEAEVDMDNCIVKTPKRKDYNRHFGNVKKLRKRALRYSRRMNERMVKRYARLCKTPAYKRGDEVLVRYRPDRRENIPPKRRVVLKGTIVKKGKTNAMYKVRIVPPKSEKEIEKWVSIEDIANLQSETEKKKRVKQEKKRKLEELRKKLYIPMTQDDHLETFSAMGYSVVHNPRGDGNCQFEAWHSFRKFCCHAMGSLSYRNVTGRRIWGPPDIAGCS